MTQLTDRVAELVRRAERTVPGVASHAVLMFGHQTWHEAWLEELLTPGYSPSVAATFGATGWRCVVVGPKELKIDGLALRFEVHE